MILIAVTRTNLPYITNVAYLSRKRLGILSYITNDDALYELKGANDSSGTLLDALRKLDNRMNHDTFSD